MAVDPKTGLETTGVQEWQVYGPENRILSFVSPSIGTSKFWSIAQGGIINLCLHSKWLFWLGRAGSTPGHFYMPTGNSTQMLSLNHWESSCVISLTTKTVTGAGAAGDFTVQNVVAAPKNNRMAVSTSGSAVFESVTATYLNKLWAVDEQDVIARIFEARYAIGGDDNSSVTGTWLYNPPSSSTDIFNDKGIVLQSLTFVYAYKKGDKTYVVFKGYTNGAAPIYRAAAYNPTALRKSTGGYHTTPTPYGLGIPYAVGGADTGIEYSGTVLIEVEYPYTEASLTSHTIASVTDYHNFSFTSRYTNEGVAFDLSAYWAKPSTGSGTVTLPGFSIPAAAGRHFISSTTFSYQENTDTITNVKMIVYYSPYMTFVSGTTLVENQATFFRWPYPHTTYFVGNYLPDRYLLSGFFIDPGKNMREGFVTLYSDPLSSTFKYLVGKGGSSGLTFSIRDFQTVTPTPVLTGGPLTYSVTPFSEVTAIATYTDADGSFPLFVRTYSAAPLTYSVSAIKHVDIQYTDDYVLTTHFAVQPSVTTLHNGGIDTYMVSNGVFSFSNRFATQIRRNVPATINYMQNQNGLAYNGVVIDVPIVGTYSSTTGQSTSTLAVNRAPMPQAYTSEQVATTSGNVFYRRYHSAADAVTSDWWAAIGDYPYMTGSSYSAVFAPNIFGRRDHGLFIVKQDPLVQAVRNVFCYIAYGKVVSGGANAIRSALNNITLNFGTNSNPAVVTAGAAYHAALTALRPQIEEKLTQNNIPAAQSLVASLQTFVDNVSDAALVVLVNNFAPRQLGWGLAVGTTIVYLP